MVLGVKATSRALALCLAACVCWLLFLTDANFARRNSGSGEPRTIEAVSVEIAQRRPVTQSQNAPPARLSALPASAGPPAPVLWRYDSESRIVFLTQAQFVLCAQARREHRDQADCPSKNDDRAYRGPDGDSLLVLLQPRWTKQN